MTAPRSRPPVRHRAPRRRVDPRRRIVLLLGAFVVVGVLLFGVLVELQAVRPERYRALGEQQLLRTVPLDGYRGAVRDRGGFVLAMSTQARKLVVDPALIAEPPETAALLAPVLGRDEAELLEALRPDHENDRYQLLARGLDEVTATRLEELAAEHRAAMVGVFVLSDEQRVNPAGRLAANLVGATDPDLRGVSGIEDLYDEVLAGEDGRATFEGGRFGTISVGERVVEPAAAGADIVLTIDHRLQYVVDQALVEHCEAVEADGASAALSDPRTGELLALSSVVRDGEGRCVVPGANLALLHTFEPGSVLKLVTMAGAVEELGLDPEAEVEVPSHVVVGDKAFRDDHPLGPGPHPLWRVLAESSNVATIGLAKELGPEGFHGYLTAFGFGSPTGIGFAGEAPGVVRPPEEWWGSDMGSMAIGQGVTTNVVQLLAAYNAIADGGVYTAPSLVRWIVEPGAEPVDEPEPSRRVVSEATARHVAEMLTRVVTDGTGRSAAIPGYEVAGKTGTAWKPVRNADGVMRYTDDEGHRRYVVTFAGFVPADDPQLSMVVMVDEPKTQTMASAVAAPVFARITQHALRILGIPPTTTVADEVPELVRGTPAGVDAGEGGAEVEGEVAAAAADRPDPVVAPGAGRPGPAPARSAGADDG